MLSPLTLLIAGLIVLLAALQLRLRWHSARHAAWKNHLPEAVDADTRDPPAPGTLAAPYSNALLLDHWGGSEPD